MRVRVTALVVVLGIASLAGCAGDRDDASTAPDGPDAATGSNDDESAFVPWAAYRFDQVVDPRSGGSGKIQEYGYTYTREEGGQATTLDVKVENLGVSTESVRGQTMDFASGASEPQTTTAPVEVTKLRHTLTVVEDGTGERSPGDSTVVTMWMPTQPSQGMTTPWQFVHLDFVDGDATGVWESLPAGAGQSAMSLPYTEGEDATGWWGFDHLVTMYALSWWTGLFEDASLEEGSHSFGGFQYSADRDTLSVPGYSFDGWRVSWSATSDGDTGSYTVAVAPELPLPFEHTIESSTNGVVSKISTKLTSLKLG